MSSFPFPSGRPLSHPHDYTLHITLHISLHELAHFRLMSTASPTFAYGRSPYGAHTAEAEGWVVRTSSH